MAGSIPEPSYPKRGTSFFAIRYMAYVLRCGIGMEHGCEAVALLLAVSLTEDKTRYSKAVCFWNDQLTAYLGCRVERLIAIRKRVIDAGWLHYEPGRKGIPGKYWVLVPGGDENLNDASLGENSVGSLTADIPYGKAHTKADDKAHRITNDNAHHKPSPFLPTPNPSPHPSNPIEKSRAKKKFKLWTNAKREEFSEPKNVQRVFELAREAGICTIDERLHVFRLVASLVATIKPKDNLPGLIVSTLRGESGKDPWRARGSDHEKTAREWIQMIDSPPEMRRRTSDLMPESDTNAERNRQTTAFRKKYG